MNTTCEKHTRCVSNSVTTSDEIVAISFNVCIVPDVLLLYIFLNY